MTHSLLLCSLVLAGCSSSTAEPQTTSSTPQPSVTSPTTTPNPQKSDSGLSKTASTTEPKTDPQTTDPTEVKGKVESGLKFREKRKLQARFNQLNELDVVKLTLAGKEFYCYVADTNGKRMEGLMHVEEQDLAKDEAMLFLFPEPIEAAFWMRNTRIDLDIAYLDKSRKIVSMHTMKAFDETPVPAAGLTKYAVEFRKGVLKEIKAKKGEKVLWNPDLESSDSDRG
jgi:uncharacterized membrane protein (UPF0127 family)